MEEESCNSPQPQIPDSYTRMLNGSSSIGSGEDFAGLYDELKRMARGKMAMERSDHTLNATALVHEAWMRLDKSAPLQWRDRRQFYAAASEAMRRILIESARRRIAAKRGSGIEPVPLEDVNLPAPLPDERLLGVHEVLDQFEEVDPARAQIVKLRFFSGLNHQEIASLMEVSEKTIKRQWSLAKVWLYQAIDKKE